MTSSSMVVYERQLSNLLDDLVPLKKFLDDPSISDIYTNPDSQIFIRKPKVGRIGTGESISPEAVKRIILSTASLLGTVIEPHKPQLDGVIPKYQCRIHGVLPPWSPIPVIALRKPVTKIYSLLEYVQDERLPAKFNDAIYDAIVAHKNFLIGGGTGTGKTTLLNAIVNEVSYACPEERFYLVEDVAEIRCSSNDYWSLLGPAKDTLELVSGSLRSNPDRIVFGELRYGEAALELVNAWNTGHAGGVTTIHADGVETMLPRLVSLIQEFVPGQVNKGNIAQAVNVLLYLRNIPNFGPKVVDMAFVESELCNGEFRYKHVKL